MLTFRNFNIADWFSFYRIAAAPVLIIFALYELRTLFTWLLLFSFLTDAVDGYLARKFKITSPRGSQLDSLGDQITLVVGVIGLFCFETDFMMDQALMLSVVFIPYILQMILAFRKYGKATAFHTYLAKLSAVIQAIFILWLLFFEPVFWLFYLMLAIGVLETIEEIALIFLYDDWIAGVRGLYWALRDKRRKRRT